MHGIFELGICRLLLQDLQRIIERQARFKKGCELPRKNHNVFPAGLGEIIGERIENARRFTRLEAQDEKIVAGKDGRRVVAVARLNVADLHFAIFIFCLIFKLHRAL